MVLSPLAAMGAGVALTIVVWLIQAAYHALTSPLRALPGPFLSHLTNLPLKHAVISGRRIFYIDALHRAHGPIVRLSPTEVAVGADIAAFKSIHGVQSKFKKDVWYEKLTNFPRLSVFTMRDQREHGARRRLFARGFSKSYLRETWEPAVREKVGVAVEKIRGEVARGGKADLMKWWTFMATDIVGVLGFGESFGLLEAGRKTEYIRVLEAALVGNGVGAELPWVRAIVARVPVRALREAFNSSEYILAYGTKAVDNARRGGRDANLMATIMAEAEKGGGRVDDMDVRTESTSLIFAGSGTTANTLTFLSYAVLSRPALQQALEEEVAQLPEGFTDADLEQLPLLNAVINETLRLYCAVPGSLPRVVPPGGATLGGYFIPQGTTVSTQAFTLHRDETLWENAEQFDPYRWLPGRDISSGAKATFCAFGAGATSCLGINLAWMELRYGTAALLKECRGLKLADSMTPESMELENYFVITPKGKSCEVVLKVE
ncbi:sterigmatocystin biosynthesis P450 monooxygenase [Macrophomina phaseolina]|uniref:Sterigmatocystin biosynthesis P450 monooxygenase n=1 Tax=Macrophomina phaseolina TaxID=35725 RepID=A0ABQ8G110_9PEZI|nr:sterigmatocystin biosynthesis P450 monooxygenase [Macrophomina phaseolina]